MIPLISHPVSPKNELLICSSAYGDSHVSLMKIMAPTYRYYAELFSMDCLLQEQNRRLDPSRPPAWDKIVFLKHVLSYYQTVIWVDSDTILINPSHDIRKELETGYPVQLVTHHGIQPIYPNTGVWVLQNDARTADLLEKIWSHQEMVYHPWWDQAALLKLLGYEPHFLEGRETLFNGHTVYNSWVGPLNLKWNSRPFDQDTAEEPVILHFCGVDPGLRKLAMQEHYRIFLENIHS